MEGLDPRASMGCRYGCVGFRREQAGWTGQERADCSSGLGWSGCGLVSLLLVTPGALTTAASPTMRGNRRDRRVGRGRVPVAPVDLGHDLPIAASWRPHGSGRHLVSHARGWSAGCPGSHGTSLYQTRCGRLIGHQNPGLYPTFQAARSTAGLRRCHTPARQGRQTDHLGLMFSPWRYGEESGVRQRRQADDDTLDQVPESTPFP